MRTPLRSIALPLCIVATWIGGCGLRANVTDAGPMRDTGHTTTTLRVTADEVRTALRASDDVSAVIDALNARGCPLALDQVSMVLSTDGAREGGVVIETLECTGTPSGREQATFVAIASRALGTSSLDTGAGAVVFHQADGAFSRIAVTADTAGMAREIELDAATWTSLSSWANDFSAPAESPPGVVIEPLLDATMWQQTINDCTCALGNTTCRLSDAEDRRSCCSCLGAADACRNFIDTQTGVLSECLRTLTCNGFLSPDSTPGGGDDSLFGIDGGPADRDPDGGISACSGYRSTYSPPQSDPAVQLCQRVFEGLSPQDFDTGHRANAAQQLHQFLDGVNVIAGAVNVFAGPEGAAAWAALSGVFIDPINAAATAGAGYVGNYEEFGRWATSDFGIGSGTQMYCATYQSDTYSCHRPYCTEARPSFAGPVMTIECSATPTDTDGMPGSDCSAAQGPLMTGDEIQRALTATLGWPPEPVPAFFEECCREDLVARIVDPPHNREWSPPEIPTGVASLTCAWFDGGHHATVMDRADTIGDDSLCTHAPSRMELHGAEIFMLTVAP